MIKLLRLGADPLLVNSSHHTPLQLIAIKVGEACFLCTKNGSLCSLDSIFHPKILPKLLRKVVVVYGCVYMCVGECVAVEIIANCLCMVMVVDCVLFSFRIFV